MSTELVFDPPPPRRRHHGGGYLFPAAVCLLVAGAAVAVTLWAVKTGRLDVGRVAALGALAGPTERDRDYFQILTLRYDLAAVLAMKQTWGREYERVAWLDTPDAYRDYAAFYDQIDRSSEDFERRILRLRQEFTAKYGVDSKVYAKSFSAAYPETDSTFDEIEQIVTAKCRQQFVEVAGHLNDRAEKLALAGDPDLKEKIAKYRADYLPKRAKAFESQVRDAARDASGLKALRGKLT